MASVCYACEILPAQVLVRISMAPFCYACEILPAQVLVRISMTLVLAHLRFSSDARFTCISAFVIFFWAKNEISVLEFSRTAWENHPIGRAYFSFSSGRFRTTFEVARLARYPYLYTAWVPLEAYARCSNPFSCFCFGSAASLPQSLLNRYSLTFVKLRTSQYWAGAVCLCCPAFAPVCGNDDKI